MKWVLRTTSVRVSDAQGERLYDSIAQAPPDLREKIVTSVNAPEAQTILIANQKAYDQIAEGGDDLPEELRRLKPALLRHHASTLNSPAGEADNSWKRLLGGGVAAIVLLWTIWLWAIQSGT